MQERQLADLSFTPSAIPLPTKSGFEFDPVAQLDFMSADSEFFDFNENVATLSAFEPPNMDIVGSGSLSHPPSQALLVLDGPHIGFSASSLNNWTASRLLFAMDIFKNAPGTMVRENQTPWSHPRLYDDAMPRCLSGN